MRCETNRAAICWTILLQRYAARPPPIPAAWAIVERTELFTVVDGTGQPLAYLYFEDEPTRQRTMKRLSKNEAYRIARGITRLPELLTKG